MSLKNRWKMLIWICAAAGWWGVFFPDFTLTEDTYEITGKTYEELSEEEKELLEEAGIEGLLINAEPGQIKVKSRLFTIVSDYFQRK